MVHSEWKEQPETIFSYPRNIFASHCEPALQNETNGSVVMGETRKEYASDPFLLQTISLRNWGIWQPLWGGGLYLIFELELEKKSVLFLGNHGSPPRTQSCCNCTIKQPPPAAKNTVIFIDEVWIP